MGGILEDLKAAMGVESEKLAVAKAIATLSQDGVVGNPVYVEIKGQKKILPLWKVQDAK